MLLAVPRMAPLPPPVAAMLDVAAPMAGSAVQVCPSSSHTLTPDTLLLLLLLAAPPLLLAIFLQGPNISSNTLTTVGAPSPQAGTAPPLAVERCPVETRRGRLEEETPLESD